MRVFRLVRVLMLDSQYVTGSSASGGHWAISQHSGRVPSSARGMSRLAGRIRRRRKCERIAAVGLVLVRRLPWRQVTGRVPPRPAARTSCLNLTGGSGYADRGGRPRPVYAVVTGTAPAGWAVASGSTWTV